MIGPSRSPSTPEDFEATLSRAAVPPVDFAARAKGTDLEFEVWERSVPQGRGGNTSYRVIFIPTSLVPTFQVTPGQLAAISHLGDTVCVMPALNDGGKQRTMVANRSKDRGWYTCIAIGQRGMLGNPTGMIRSPWGVS